MTTQEERNTNGSGPSAEELRQHALDLLNSRQETLKSEIETMLSEHRERLEAARRSILSEFERERDETSVNQSISTLLNQEESNEVASDE